MKKNNTLLLSAMVIFFCSCHQQKQYLSYNGQTQGTSFHILYETTKGKEYTRKIDSILTVVEKHFSLWDTSSILSQINRNAYRQVLPPLFVELFTLARKVYDDSKGAFDPTIAPLIDLWGFGPEHKINPDTSQINDMLALVGMNKIKIKNNILYKDHPDITLNFNAIAQGYTVDLIADFFEKEGIENYLVEIGGEVRVKGVNPRGKYWRIGIDKPDETNILPGNSLQSIVQLHNLSVSTSGNYRNYYYDKGVRYAHTIDPETGRPVTHNLLSATVFSPRCVLADAYATAMMVMGKEKAVKLAHALHLDVYLIYTDSTGTGVYMTDHVRRMLTEELRP